MAWGDNDSEFQTDSGKWEGAPDKTIWQSAVEAGPILAKALASYGTSAMSGFNKGLFAPARKLGLTKAIGKAINPNLSDAEAEAMAEFRNLTAERENPTTAGLASGVGITPYVAGMSALAGPGASLLGTGALEGALGGALLSDAKDLKGQLKDTAIGMPFGAVGKAFPAAMGKLEQKLEGMSARGIFRAGNPQGAEVATLRDQQGTPTGDIGVQSGRTLRDMTDPTTGKPVVTALGNEQDRLASLGRTMEHHGKQINPLIEEADKAKPGSVELDSLLDRIRDAADSIGGGPDDVFGGGKVASFANDLYRRFREHVTGYKPTSTNVEYPAPPQGQLGLPGETSRTVTGSALHPSEPGPPININERGIYSRARSRAGEDSARTSSLDVDALYTGQARVIDGRKMIYDPQDPRSNANGWIPEEWFGKPRPEPEIPYTGNTDSRVYPGTNRPQPDNGTYVAREHVPAQEVPSSVTTHQRDLFTGNSFPEAGTPQATSTNVAIKRMDIKEAIDFMRWLDNDVYVTSRQLNPTMPQEAISKSPQLRFEQKLAGIFRDEANKGFGRALPEKAAHFERTNKAFSDAADWRYVFENRANAAATRGEGPNVSAWAARHFLIPSGLVGGGIATAAGNPMAGALLGVGGVASDVAINLMRRYGHGVVGRGAQALRGPALQLAQSDPRALLQALMAESIRKREE